MSAVAVASYLKAFITSIDIKNNLTYIFGILVQFQQSVKDAPGYLSSPIADPVHGEGISSDHGLQAPIDYRQKCVRVKPILEICLLV